MTSNEETTSTSKTTTSSELESEEISTETTVPTDLTLTLSPELDFISKKPTQIVTKQLLERKQLLHDLQLLKIELSQKTLMLDNLKADYMARSEDLEEKLAEALHQKLILQARLESQLQIQHDEAKSRLEKTKQEMKIILEKQQQLEETNAKLHEKATEVRQSLYNLEISEKEYQHFNIQDESQLSLRDYIAKIIYEMVWSYKKEQQKLVSQVDHFTNDNQQLKYTNENLNEELNIEKRKCFELQSKYNRLASELNDVKSQLLTGDHKIENYDKIKSERDKFMEDFLETKNTLSTCQATSTALAKELEAVKSERASLQQKVSLLQQDKDYLNKKQIELSSQLKNGQDQLSKTTLQLEKISQAREDIYEKYVTARDIYKSEFERKLQEELINIQSKTSSEIEGLRKRAIEINEQEIRSLKDSRDLAFAQRDKAEAAERQAMTKYEGLLEELRRIQSSDTIQLSNLKGQFTLKSFEAEQTKTILTETQRNLEMARLENEKLLNKFEILNNEFHELGHTTKKRVIELEMQLQSKSHELAVYERLEHDLDDIVMQAAEVTDWNDSEKMVLTIGPSKAIPTTMKRRLQHSFHLAKRILYLEKQNAELKQKFDNEKDISKGFSDEITSLKELLDYAQKPNSFLIDTIKAKDEQIRHFKLTVEKMSEENAQANNEKKQLQSKVEMLTEDVKKLLENRKEIEKMKQSLVAHFPRQLRGASLSGPSSIAAKPVSSTNNTKKPNAVKRPSFRN